tara:strand:+ start:53 stop:544 length:492 start_codon:yes stop_codon:yes gene_type:complete
MAKQTAADRRAASLAEFDEDSRRRHEAKHGDDIPFNPPGGSDAWKLGHRSDFTTWNRIGEKDQYGHYPVTVERWLIVGGEYLVFHGLYSISGWITHHPESGRFHWKVCRVYGGSWDEGYSQTRSVAFGRCADSLKECEESDKAEAAKLRAETMRAAFPDRDAG